MFLGNEFTVPWNEQLSFAVFVVFSGASFACGAARHSSRHKLQNQPHTQMPTAVNNWGSFIAIAQAGRLANVTKSFGRHFEKANVTCKSEYRFEKAIFGLFITGFIYLQCGPDVHPDGWPCRRTSGTDPDAWSASSRRSISAPAMKSRRRCSECFLPSLGRSRST